MRIVFIRHFKTSGNLRGAYIGETDEELLFTEDTAAEAEAIRVKLREVEMEHPDQVVISPMKRCRQTAELLYRERIPYPQEGLRECKFGIFEGRNYEELKEVPAYQKWLESGGRTAFPEGEGRVEFQRRCVQSFREVLRFALEKGDKRIVFIVHGGTIMALMSCFDKERKTFYDYQLRSGEGYLVHIDDKKWQQGMTEFERTRRL